MNKTIHNVRAIAITLLLVCFASLPSWATETQNPSAVTSLLNRIGGSGTADRFVTIVDESLAENGKDVFVITSQDGKPCIKGNTILAVTTGINWYLNHNAHVNLAWNNLTTDLSAVTLPTPTSEEKHTCSVDYRYYLNYCTFSYSMSTWTWERWQQEIDWMALHGINMPLQIIGLDVVWKNLLTKDYGYTSDEANNFIAGPCFQAWWGMNNLEGWGGANPDWWYTRQEALATKILARERELGMQPVLPGYAGMVPSDFTTKTGNASNNQGNWCYFTRPYILDPNSDAFTTMAANYYKRLEEVMGTSEYYSMDPFHEGANTDGIDVASAYNKIATAMTTANSNGKWVIQFWQWSSAQYNVLSQVDQGKLIVLDLFSDAHTHFNEYSGHDAVYCILPNFGGRTGLFGRLSKVITEFFSQKSSYSNIKGIGATPEAIEQVPVLYDAAFELPWYTSAPDPKTWLANYATARYGSVNTNAQDAWEKIRNSALNCETSLQGPHEAVLCARPALQVGSVSSWGGTDIFYDAQDVVDAAYKLLQAKESLSGENYSYDLTDFSRQALTDYGYYLLKAINTAYTGNDTEAYKTRRDAYLALILDLDELLNTNKNFMLGRWTQMARAIADEVSGTTTGDKQWLELNNARTLITTWGNEYPSEFGGLRDYSYREWGGMMKDFYYPRWKTFFENLDNGSSQPYWYTTDWAWAHNAEYSYSNTPTGETSNVAATLFSKYFVPLTLSDGTTNYYVYRYMHTDGTKNISYSATRGEKFNLPISALPSGVTAILGIDLNNDGVISEDEQSTGEASLAIPTTAATGKVSAKLTLSDGTTLSFRVVLKDYISTARTVSVQTSDSQKGSVSIEGTSDLSVTNTDEVTISASPVTGYDFINWTDANGNAISTDNPYTYFGADAATFTANFETNKWGAPTEDTSEKSTISDYKQYLSAIGVVQNSGEEQSIYSVDAMPSALCQTTQTVNAPQGSKLTIHWTGAGGLNYCRASAYADFNCDGDFDDDGEFIGVIGDKSSSGNSALNDYSLDVLLPYDAAEGITHIRIRFDSSWLTDGLDSSTDAIPAKNATKRMVYDIPVNVTTQSATATTVTVESGDTKKGTVDANGQTDTYTYKVGEQIVLRAYPATGYKVKNWTDQYGREVPTSWVDGNFLRFYAPESGTYTCNFTLDRQDLPDQLTIGNWTFDYEMDNEDIILTKAVSGSGELVVPEKYTGYTIKGISSTALQGQTELTSLSLPSTIQILGSNSYLFSTSFNGAGINNKAIPLNSTISGSSSWTLDMEVANDGSTYNQWGSGLLATGTDALASTYTNGFQLYLSSSGNVIFKTGDSETTITTTQGAKNFQLQLAYNADDDQMSITAINGSEQSTTVVSNISLNDITQFASSIPAGVNINSLKITLPNDDAYVLDNSTITGDGKQSSKALTTSLKNESAWNIHMDVTSDGSTFNQWGSALLASGTAPLEGSYDAGFQFYYNAAGNIIFKHSGSTEQTFTSTQGQSSFQIDVTHTADKTLTVNVIVEGKDTETFTLTNYTLNDISNLSYALPSGVNIEKLLITNPEADPALFRGCTALSEITIDSNNQSYKAIDNVVYSADGAKLLAYPEGKITHAFSIPTTVTSIGDCAFTSALELDRIIPTSSSNIELGINALGDETFFVQLTPANANSYRSVWGIPVVFNASVNSSLTSTSLSNAEAGDAVNITSDATQSGTAQLTDAISSVWLTTTVSADELRPISLPTLPSRITVEGLSVNDTKISDLKLYAYNDGVFTLTSEPAAGTYIMEVPETWTGKQICMQFAQTTNSTETEGFVGNSATSSRTLTTAYAYNASTNHYILDKTTKETTLYPFHALLVGDNKSATVVSGPVVEGKSYLLDFRTSPYITFYSDQSISIPDSVKAAYISLYDNKLYYHYDYPANTAAPANTGIILKSTKGNTYNAKVTTSDAESPTDNLLHGYTTDATTYVEGDDYKYYRLCYADAERTKLGFYFAVKNGGAFTSKAYKAFLAIPRSESISNSHGFNMTDIDDVTGIHQIINSEASHPDSIYDLSGRKINANKALLHGIYIVNGKKIIAH